MQIGELILLKAEYEKELLLAEAKVAVIKDIIAKFEEIEETQTADEAETDEPEQFAQQTY